MAFMHNNLTTIALQLTAHGLTRGKSYDWKGISVNPIKDMYGGVTWKVKSSDENVLTTNHPLEAAIKFMQLVQVLNNSDLSQ